MRMLQHWHNATVTALADLTPTVREFHITPDERAVRPYAPGSHLQVRLQISNGNAQTRTYSLVGEPNSASYRIAVKRMDTGRGGSRHMWQLTTGDRLIISEPQNHFPLSFDSDDYLLIAGGIGVTPLISMVQALTGFAQRSGARVRFCYGARSTEELAYREVLEDALGEHLVTFSADAGQRINFDAEIAPLSATAQVYCCGPVPMLDALKTAWHAAGRPLQNLRFESFGNSGHTESQSFTVKLPRHQLELRVAADCSLLDALESAGVPVLYDCRRGECGLCAMDVIGVDGELDHRDVFLSAHEKAASTRICACVSRAVGDITLDSAYRSSIQ